MNDYGYSITGDRMVSMPKGPVLSQTLNLITGDYASDEFGWGAWIKSEKNYEISLKRKKDVTRDDFESLSDAELGVLDAIWEQFGHMNCGNAGWDFKERKFTYPIRVYRSLIYYLL